MSVLPLEPQDPRQLGRFRITARLGEGGQGIVYLGVDPQGRPVEVPASSRQFAARVTRTVIGVFATARAGRSYAGPIPAVVHLHGAEVPSQFDGHPEAWFTPENELKGRAYVTNAYQYPNTQEATTLWFHDHALGVVRLNVLAGLAGAYFIRDGRDTGRADNAITLPSGPQEVELLLQDRQFDTNGQIYFPDSDNPANLNGPPANPDRHPFWIPEFFGDVIAVNGKSWPMLEVEPRRYRFRWVNGSNARFYIMQMFDQRGLDMHVNGPPGPAIWQIGSDGGLFNAPVKLADPANGPNAKSCPM